MSRPRLLLSLILFALFGHAWAQSSASYQIPRQSVDAGAGVSSSASYQLRGTVGQPDAGTAVSASYVLTGGFHTAASATPQPDPVFADGFE